MKGADLVEVARIGDNRCELFKGLKLVHGRIMLCQVADFLIGNVKEMMGAKRLIHLDDGYTMPTQCETDNVPQGQNILKVG